MSHKKVLFVVAHTGYQSVEYNEPKRILQQAGFVVVTASNKEGTATAKDGSTTAIAVTISHVSIQDYEGIIFIGGPGAMDALDNEESYELLREAFAQEKIIGAICVAPRILANAGILTSVAATGWDEDGQLKGIFNASDVHYTPAPVVVDQDIVTAQGPQAAQEFGKELLRLLTSKTT